MLVFEKNSRNKDHYKYLPAALLDFGVSRQLPGGRRVVSKHVRDTWAGAMSLLP